MADITKYPKYKDSVKEIPVSARDGLRFIGRAFVSIENRFPIIVFSLDDQTHFRYVFPAIFNSMEGVDDLMGLELHMMKDMIALRLFGSSNYVSTKAFSRSSLHKVVHLPQTHLVQTPR